jgi:hypothetical protein
MLNMDINWVSKEMNWWQEKLSEELKKDKPDFEIIKYIKGNIKYNSNRIELLNSFKHLKVNITDISNELDDAIQNIFSYIKVVKKPFKFNFLRKFLLKINIIYSYLRLNYKYDFHYSLNDVENGNITIEKYNELNINKKRAKKLFKKIIRKRIKEILIH